MARGDYLVVLKAEGRQAVLYPLDVQHGEQARIEVYIPRSLPPGMVYVPAGRFKFGEMDSPHVPQRRVTLPGFFIRSNSSTLRWSSKMRSNLI